MFSRLHKVSIHHYKNEGVIYCLNIGSYLQQAGRVSNYLDQEAQIYIA